MTRQPPTPTPGHGARLRSADYVLAIALGLATVLLLGSTTGMGFTRDESFYYHAAREYSGWFAQLEDDLEAGNLRESFTQESIDRHWSYNPEHPVLVKTLFALSHRYLDVRNDVLSPGQAVRFPGWLFTGLLTGVMYLFTLRAFGSRAAAVLAPLLVLSIPRFFFHGHLACFDMPITAVWYVFMYAYWRSLGSTRWAWVTGALWGVALMTKLNAFFLPLVILGHWGLRALPSVRLSRGRVEVPRVPFALFAMALLGPVIFVAGWPRVWFETLDRIGWYLQFHAQHEHYFVEYFGRGLIRPPFPVAFPFVMTLVTTPVAHLAAFASGSAFLLSEWIERLRARAADADGTGLLLALNIAVPFVIIANPSTPVFGGVKHWMPALPFMCMVAAIGVVRAAEAVGEWASAARGGAFGRRVRAGLIAAQGAIAVGAGAYETADLHPYETSHYNAVLGSITGAADHRMMRQFWGYASRGALEWINENAPPNARVHFHDTTPGAMAMYQQEGWLRDDVSFCWDLDRCHLFIYNEEEAFEPLRAQVWDRFGTQSPVFTVTTHGVPVITVYRNERLGQ